MSKIKNSGLDQHAAEPLKQQQFGTGGIKGANTILWSVTRLKLISHILHACQNISLTATTCTLNERRS